MKPRSGRAAPRPDGASRSHPDAPRRTPESSADYLTTVELARLLRLQPKKVYALARQGRLPVARVTGKWLFPRALVTQWLAEHTVYPTGGLLQALLDRALVLQGSDDWLLGRAIDALRPRLGRSILVATVGSLAGLRAVAEGLAHVASFHVADDDVAGFAGRGSPWYLVTLSAREQGLVLPRRLRRSVKSMGDVVGKGLRFADRQESAGTHRLARRLLARSGAPGEALRAVGPFSTHIEAAMAVRTGEADVGLGIRVAAERCGLEFVPLETETFQLAIPATVLGHPSGSAFLEQLLESLRESSRRGAPGYSLRSLGRMRPAPIRTATERAAPPEPLS